MRRQHGVWCNVMSVLCAVYGVQYVRTPPLAESEFSLNSYNSGCLNTTPFDVMTPNGSHNTTCRPLYTDLANDFLLCCLHSLQFSVLSMPYM